MERRALSRRSELFERTKADIANRLRAVCPAWADRDFEKMIARMATVSIKYSQRRDILYCSELYNN